MNNLFKWIILLGLAIVLAGFFYNKYFINIPLQCAPKELLLANKDKIFIASSLVLTGLIAFTIGILGQMWKNRKNNRRKLL